MRKLVQGLALRHRQQRGGVAGMGALGSGR